MGVLENVKDFFVGFKDSFSKKTVIYYAIGMGFILLIVAFFIMKKFEVFSRLNSGGKSPVKGPKPPKPKKEHREHIDRRLERAKKRILAAQRAIHKARDQERISVMKKKIAEENNSKNP